PAVVALMRSRLVREVAQEHADVIAETVAAQREAGGTTVVRDTRAADRLAWVLPLWAQEIAAVVRRERRRLVQEALVARLAEVRAATAATSTAVEAELAGDDLDVTEVHVAMAAAAQPVGMVPEDPEDSRGHSM